jgi:outer membrane protein
MRTIVFALAAVLLSAVAVPASAEVKIAVVRLAVLLNDEGPLVGSAGAKFKGEFQKREDDLRAEEKRLGDDIGRFRREADTMSPQQRTTAQNDLNTRKTNLEVKQRQFAEQAQQRQSELRRNLLEQVERAIAEVAKEKGLDIVLPEAAYASAAYDITPDVMKKLSSAEPKPAADAKPKKK